MSSTPFTASLLRPAERLADMNLAFLTYASLRARTTTATAAAVPTDATYKAT